MREVLEIQCVNGWMRKMRRITILCFIRESLQYSRRMTSSLSLLRILSQPRKVLDSRCFKNDKRSLKYSTKRKRKKFSRKLRHLSHRSPFQESRRILGSPQTVSPSRLTTRSGESNRMGVKGNEALGRKKSLLHSRASKTKIKGWCLTRAPRGITTTDRLRCTVTSCKETNSEEWWLMGDQKF